MQEGKKLQQVEMTVVDVLDPKSEKLTLWKSHKDTISLISSRFERRIFSHSIDTQESKEVTSKYFTDAEG